MAAICCAMGLATPAQDVPATPVAPPQGVAAEDAGLLAAAGDLLTSLAEGRGDAVRARLLTPEDAELAEAMHAEIERTSRRFDAGLVVAADAAASAGDEPGDWGVVRFVVDRIEPADDASPIDVFWLAQRTDDPAVPWRFCPATPRLVADPGIGALEAPGQLASYRLLTGRDQSPAVNLTQTSNNYFAAYAAGDADTTLGYLVLPECPEDRADLEAVYREMVEGVDEDFIDMDFRVEEAIVFGDWGAVACSFDAQLAMATGTFTERLGWSFLAWRQPDGRWLLDIGGVSYGFAAADTPDARRADGWVHALDGSNHPPRPARFFASKRMRHHPPANRLTTNTFALTLALAVPAPLSAAQDGPAPTNDSTTTEAPPAEATADPALLEAASELVTFIAEGNYRAVTQRLLTPEDEALAGELTAEIDRATRQLDGGLVVTTDAAASVGSEPGDWGVVRFLVRDADAKPDDPPAAVYWLAQRTDDPEVPWRFCPVTPRLAADPGIAAAGDDGYAAATALLVGAGQDSADDDELMRMANEWFAAIDAADADAVVARTILPDDPDEAAEMEAELREGLEEGMMQEVDFRMEHIEGHGNWAAVVFSIGGDFFGENGDRMTQAMLAHRGTDGQWRMDPAGVSAESPDADAQRARESVGKFTGDLYDAPTVRFFAG